MKKVLPGSKLIKTYLEFAFCLKINTPQFQNWVLLRTSLSIKENIFVRIYGSVIYLKYFHYKSMYSGNGSTAKI